MRSGPSLQDRKQDLVRGAIWDAAVALFVARGFDSVTVDEIARAAGVSKRSFFRYFASKNDLMGHGIVTYGTMITEAIRACPGGAAPIEVMRQTVEQVAVSAAAHPRVRKIAQIAGASVAAREAQLSRLADVEERVADACRARWPAAARTDLTPRLLAGLILTVLDVTFREWLKQEDQDIAATVDDVFGSLLRLVGMPGDATAAQVRRRGVRVRMEGRGGRSEVARRPRDAKRP